MGIGNDAMRPPRGRDLARLEADGSCAQLPPWIGIGKTEDAAKEIASTLVAQGKEHRDPKTLGHGFRTALHETSISVTPGLTTSANLLGIHAIVLLAVVSECDEWVEVVLHARCRITSPRTIPELPDGIAATTPSGGYSPMEYRPNPSV